MSTADWVEYLKISTMVLFHVFILISIIGSIFVFAAIRSVQKKINETLAKADETLDNIKEAAWSVGEAGGNFADFLTPLIFQKRNRNKGGSNLIGSLISGFFKR